MESILVDQDRAAFSNLQKFAATKNLPGFGGHALCGEFVEMIPAIEKLIGQHGKDPFRFVFLDPHGWADIPMLRLQSFLRHRSCEVLINLMTRHIIRFLKEPDRSESYHNLFGRQTVLETLRNMSPGEREDQAVWEYCTSLKVLCNFAYVSSAVILESDQESVRYFLVYATNHPRGVEVFKAAETQTAKIQDNIRHETHIRKTRQPGFLFDAAPPSSRLVLELRKRYTKQARVRVLNVLSANTSPAGVLYADLFCEAMAFPLVTPDDLVGWLQGWEPSIKFQLEAPNFTKPSPSRNDRVVVINLKELKP